MPWKPDPEPTRYDRARAARLAPLRQAVQKLRLPPGRGRKLLALLNALEVQIEDGGDSPDVNQHLLAALRAGLHHQVSERQARAALQAIDAFAEDEARRWAQIRAGTLPPIVLTPEEQLDDWVQAGYALLKARQRMVAVDQWLAAWEQVKKMATPTMRTVQAFDAAYRGLFQSVFNWCSDLEMELHNAGLDDSSYFVHCIRYVDEFLAQFPDEDAGRYVSMLRAKGEALWELGRQAEAEAVYQDLIARYPDEGWGYIGWSDQYYLYGQAKVYERAEAVLLRALARPALKDRADVQDRLTGLYAAWGKPEKPASSAAPPSQSSGKQTAPPSPRPKRNAPCWCGSGKKYKYCHMLADQARDQ